MHLKLTCGSYEKGLYCSLLSALNILHFSFCPSDAIETAFLKVLNHSLIAKSNGFFLLVIFWTVLHHWLLLMRSSFLNVSSLSENKVILKIRIPLYVFSTVYMIFVLLKSC